MTPGSEEVRRAALRRQLYGRVPGALIALVLISVVAVPYFTGNRADTPLSSGEEQVLDAYHNQRSEVWMVVSGEVEHQLKDDQKGTPHQRFILRLSNGHTLLVAHNTALAERVPVRAGDDLSLRGRYEWNHKGGVMHWTHHDPDGDIEGGWIEHRGQRYQ